MLDKRSRVVTVAGRDPPREVRLMRGSRWRAEPPEAGADLANPGRRIADYERLLMHEMSICSVRISWQAVRIFTCTRPTVPAVIVQRFRWFWQEGRSLNQRQAQLPHPGGPGGLG